MNKKLRIFLIILLLFSITACGKKSSNYENEKDNNENNELTGEKENETVVTVGGDVLYEDELYKVVFKEYDYDESRFVVRLNIENKTDIEVNVEATDKTINSSMILGNFNEDLAPKTETEFFILYDSSILNKNNINSLEDVKEIVFKLTFWKIGNDDIRREINLKLYPHEDHNYEYINYKKQEGDIVLVENDDFIIYGRGFEKYKSSAVYLELYAYNKTDKDINIFLDESIVNGKRLSTTPKQLHVLPGKELIEDFSWWADEEIISNFKTLSFRVVIRDANTYIDTYYISEVINLNPVIG